MDILPNTDAALAKLPFPAIGEDYKEHGSLDRQSDEAKRAVVRTGCIPCLPILRGLEIEAKLLQGKTMQQRVAELDLNLPEIGRIHSLDHAHFLFHSVYIGILGCCQDTRPDQKLYQVTTRMADRHRLFAPWLKQWEQAFSELLFGESNSLSVHDLTRAKVLKANLIAANTIIAVDHSRDSAGRTSPDSSFIAILNLSAAVLEAHTVGPVHAMSTFQFPIMSYGLWLAEPLLIKMANCADLDVRRQAAGLLSGP